ncbi:hypothetical protein CPC08DRAFT_717688, partial [Agrocybe pediades]
LIPPPPPPPPPPPHSPHSPSMFDNSSSLFEVIRSRLLCFEPHRDSKHLMSRPSRPRHGDQPLSAGE